VSNDEEIKLLKHQLKIAVEALTVTKMAAQVNGFDRHPDEWNAVYKHLEQALKEIKGEIDG
jgi:hypothetical protein